MKTSSEPAVTAMPARLPKKLSRRLLTGFAILVGLMAGLTAYAVHQMQDQEDRMRDIVELRNRKIQAATALLEATYNRHTSLIYQAMVEDPFERDAHFQQYLKWGYAVGKARNELRALGLDAFESANLQRQDRLVEGIIDLHEKIADLARNDQLEMARNHIIGTLRPFTLQFIDTVSDLQRHERDQIQHALAATRLATQRAILVDLALGLALTLLASVSALFIYRQMRNYVRTIDGQMRALEKTGTQLKHEATHDPLTGLANRSLFYHRLREAIAHARQEGLKAVILYADLDDFKAINDSHGHAAGDALLQTVAGRLLKSVRATDTVARLGGDEFALILLGMGDDVQIDKIRHGILENVHQPVQVQAITLHPSCSLGQAIFPTDGDSMDHLLQVADARMYEIKRTRKARPH